MNHRLPTALAVALPLALSFALLFSLSPSLAQAASDSELAEIRRQLQQMKAAYEQRIASLEQRLAATETVVGEQGAAPRGDDHRAHAEPTGPEISLHLQGQYRSMKNLPERRISGFWPATAHDHDDSHGLGADKRGFSIDHTELVLAADLAPLWRGQAMFALQDGEVEVEEAWFQSLGIGHGIGLKGGRLRSGLGYLNEQHTHARDFADAPLIYKAMFGEHGSYAQDGLQLKWMAPTPFFLEFGAEIGRDQNFPGTDRNKNGSGAGTFFAHVGDDIGTSHSWRAGVSYLQTRAWGREAHFEDAGGLDEAVGSFDGRSKTWGADFVWKWAPDGNPEFRNFKLQGEYFQRRERGTLVCSNEEQDLGNNCDPSNAGDSVASSYRTRQSGWYLQGVYQFTRNWRAGLRYDRLDSGRRDFGANEANLVVDRYQPKRVTLMADYSWSEFSRLRLQFAQDKSMKGVTDNQVWLQYIMSLGSHAGHSH